MARTTIKFDLGDGRLKSLSAQLRRLDRELNKIYNRGQSNNNTISNRDLTNLQQLFRAFQQATIGKKDQLSEELQQAQLSGNARLANTLYRELKELVEAQQTSNQFFLSDRYQQVNQYRVKSSKAFRDPKYDSELSDLRNRVGQLSKELGQLSNRSKIFDSRWDTSYNTGVISHERFEQYRGTGQTLFEQVSQGRDQFNELRKEYNNTLTGYQNQRDHLQDLINQGGDTQDLIKQRSAIDEQIEALKKYGDTFERLSYTLGQTQQRVKQTQGKVETASDDPSLKILSPENSISGILRNRAGFIARTAIASGLATARASINTGDRERLDNFDNIKSIAYARNGQDHRVMMNLANAGYDMGLNIDQTAQFTNAYTSSTGNANLNKSQLSDLTKSWGGLYQYSGAKEQTTLALAYMVGVTGNYQNARKSSSIARSIQNEITNSGMSAKADEQQSALTSMYQVASQSAGGLSASGQREIAGFQGQMASLGSDMQGQQGAQAYSGLVSAFNPMSKEARMIWGGEDPQYRTQRGQADLTERMQKAPEHPEYYREPIKNLLTHASATTNNKGKQREIAASNLVQLSGGSLSMDQANKMIKAYQDGKFTKKRINSIVKGNGKGQKDKYDMTSIKGRQQYYASYKKNAIQTSHALDTLRKKLTWINRILPFAPSISGIAQGGISTIADLGTRAFIKNPRGSFKSARNFMLKSSVFNAEKAGRTGSLRNLFKRGAKISDKTAQEATRGFKGSGKGKLIGMGLTALGTTAMGLFSSSDKADASTRGTDQDSKAEPSIAGKHKGKKSKVQDINKLRSSIKAKRKLLWHAEWRLIDYLNDYWDILLRKAKEMAKNSNGDDGGDISGLSGKGDKAIRAIAKAVAKKDNLDAKLVYAQLALESADGTSQEAVKDNNFSGIKGSGGGAATDDGGTYQHFDSISDFANRYAEVLKAFPLHKGMSPEEYASALKHGKYGAYYTADEGSYAAQLKTWADKYALGGIRNHALGGNFDGVTPQANNNLTNQMLTDIRTVQQMTRIRQPRNYIKTVRNKAKINTNIQIESQGQPSKQDLIDQVINDTFNLWVNNKQAQQLNDYFANESSGLI